MTCTARCLKMGLKQSIYPTIFQARKVKWEHSWCRHPRFAAAHSIRVVCNLTDSEEQLQ